MKINYHLLTIFEYNQTQNLKQQKQPPFNNRPKRLLLQASSYLSIGQQDKVLKDENRWDGNLAPTIFALCAMVHSTTQYTPA